MKSYKFLNKKYMKKNTFIDCTFSFYRMKVFFVLVLSMILVVCSVFFYKLSLIEKNESKPKIILVLDIEDTSNNIYYYFFEQHPEIEFVHYNSTISKYDYDANMELQKYNIDFKMASFTTNYFTNTCLFISEYGYVSFKTTDFNFKDIYNKLLELGWVNENAM